MIELIYHPNGNYDSFQRLEASRMEIFRDTRCVIMVPYKHYDGSKVCIGVVSEPDGDLESALGMIKGEIGLPQKVKADTNEDYRRVDGVLCKYGHATEPRRFGRVLNAFLSDERMVVKLES